MWPVILGAVALGAYVAEKAARARGAIYALVPVASPSDPPLVQNQPVIVVAKMLSTGETRVLPAEVAGVAGAGSPYTLLMLAPAPGVVSPYGLEPGKFVEVTRDLIQT